MKNPQLAVLLTVIATAGALPLDTAAQTCVGLPGDNATVTVGFQGTDGASGRAAALSVRTGRISAELSGASLDRFAQEDNDVSLGGRLAWDLNTNSIQTCLVGGSQWTSFDASRSATQFGNGPIQYNVLGSFQRLRTPIGFSVGDELLAERAVSVVPFASLTVVHDYERMRWVADGTETRSSFGLGTSLGLTVAYGRVLLRSQLTNAATSQRMLSGHNNHVYVVSHLGLAF